MTSPLTPRQRAARMKQVREEDLAAKRSGRKVRWLISYEDRANAVMTWLTCVQCDVEFLAIASEDVTPPPFCSERHTADHQAGRVDEQAEARRLSRAEQAELRRLEAERVRRCPRPDKEVWLTLEAAERVVELMRAQERARARNLHGYQCACGAYHIGDRTRLAGDAVTERWGPADG